jgi:hypothetical protein
MKSPWKKLLLTMVFLVVITIASLLILNLVAQCQVSSYKKALIAKGEKLEVAEVLPPAVPAGSNGMDSAEMAFKALGSGGIKNSELIPMMKMIPPGRVIVEWQQPILGDEKGLGYSNSWAGVEASVKSVKPALDLFRQAAKFQMFDFHLEYEKGPETLVPHLHFLETGARTLGAAAICDLHNGNPASAITNICVLLSLVRETHDERLIRSQFIRMRMASIAMSATWEMLQATNLADKDLACLQRAWETVEYINAFSDAMLMERASMDAFFVSGQKSSSYFLWQLGYSQGLWHDLKVNTLNHVGMQIMWRTKWKYSNESDLLHDDESIIELLRTVQTNGFFYPGFGDLEKRLDEASDQSESTSDFLVTDLNRIGAGTSYSCFSDLDKMMNAEASRRLGITAIALERFKIKHERYPEKLIELAPEFLQSASLDIVDGAVLRYHLNGDGAFLLYSIGKDGKDDGGKVSGSSGVIETGLNSHWLDYRTQDLIWPQPATPAEIERYYADEAAKAK